MRDLFLLDSDLVFLNHGSFGACPREVVLAQRDWQLEMERNPVAFLSRRSGALLRQAREALALYLHASADDLVFIENATTGVNIIAHSVALAPGDEVLCTSHEYGACEAAFKDVCARAQARLTHLPVALPLVAAEVLERFQSALSPATRLVMISHISSPTALRFPVEEMIRMAQARGILVLIDGAHAPAFLDLDLDALGADFYSGNCHKWMCAPKGAAFLHVRRDRHALVRAPIISWGYATEGRLDDPHDLITGTGVLERHLQWLGTRDLSAFLSVPAAIAFMQQHDWPAVRERCRALARTCAHRLHALFGTTPIGSDDVVGQMVAVALPPVDATALRAALFERHRIEMPIMVHEGREYARFSVQAYNTEADLRHLEAVLPGEVERARRLA